jgi:hypothetical protein
MPRLLRKAGHFYCPSFPHYFFYGTTRTEKIGFFHLKLDTVPDFGGKDRSFSGEAAPAASALDERFAVTDVGAHFFEAE